MKKSKLNRHLLSFCLITIFGFISCKQTSKVENLKSNSDKKYFASYNHTALVVKNLDSSVAFYHYVFEFDTIHYPFPYRENIRAKWMSTGNDGELHLGEFKGDTTEYYYPGHIGFTVLSIDTILSRLNKLDYKLPEMENMPNGERTINFKDIDGNNIHIIERKQ
jgi:catechol 2,3-dioxygenase-like lactoylglutathione lyase family enzyme